MSSTKEEAAAFDKTTQKGAEGGLFRACMTSIRGAHKQANRLRAGLVVAGMFTDKSIYTQVITLFYCINKELEEKLVHLAGKGDDVCTKLLGLGYNLTQEWEQDLAALFTPETWKEQVESILNNNETTLAYRKKVQSMAFGTELAGVAFVLWGGLIIGGGAAIMPRVKALCGDDAIHIYKAVTGPEREKQKKQFIQTWDSLAEPGTPDFEQIEKSAAECMLLNNDVLSSVQQRPWWWKYLIAAAIGLCAVIIALLSRRLNLNFGQS